MISRVKSLSKSNNPKKDLLAPMMNLRESTTVPMSSVLANSSPYEDEQDDSDDFDIPEDNYEPPKPSRPKNVKLEQSLIPTFEDRSRRPSGQSTWKDVPKVDSRNTQPDDDLSALLKVIYRHNSSRNTNRVLQIKFHV